MYTPSGETVAETRVCPVSGEVFPVFSGDIDFYEKISPIFAGKKELIPPPTLCPDCRHRRRLAFRNERKLYKENVIFPGRILFRCIAYIFAVFNLTQNQIQIQYICSMYFFYSFFI